MLCRFTFEKDKSNDNINMTEQIDETNANEIEHKSKIRNKNDPLKILRGALLPSI